MSKKRKPRTKGYDIDFDGAHFNGEPTTIFRNTPAFKKMLHRYYENLCLGCGKKECQCKSKMGNNDKHKSKKG